MDELKKLLDRLMEKQDNQTDYLYSIDKILLKNTLALEEHIRRTNLLEEQVNKLNNEIQPIKSHVEQVQGAGNLLKWIGLSATIIISIITIYRFSK